ncbi:23940_t:CDS:2 [Dentiscutata erythropus]|uniref:23940_t:CDS:1 n=1 Tax=Dentiscutata erythropus TaxID=1348616 RepID=A0A9N9AVI9_9GLOM|nr:23940_t:CDS:2 [Dentiscutata erythropus]
MTTQDKITNNKRKNLQLSKAQVLDATAQSLAATTQAPIFSSCTKILTLAELLKKDKFIVFLREFNNDSVKHVGAYEGYYYSHLHMLIKYIGHLYKSKNASS